MNRKKWISLLLAVIMLLSLSVFAGCGKKEEPKDTTADVTTPSSQTEDKTDEKAEETKEEEEAEVEEVPLPDEIAITKTYYFGDASDHPEWKENWAKAMEEQYGIKFVMTYPPRSNYTEKINLMITSGELKGLVQLFTPDEAIKMYEDGAIEDLSEYLKDNPVWNSMPEDFRTMYEVDGKILGIPAGLTGDIFVRAIRTDWLENLGLDMPETVEELYEVSRAFTLEDPDGNGKDDTVGMTSSGTWNLQDIFQAFDARLNHVGGSSLAWNPNTGVWEDSMLKPEMIECLTYLADMYREGYLDNELFTNGGAGMREKMMSGLYGSTFYWYDWAVGGFPDGTKKNVPEATYGMIIGLKGKIDKNINQMTYSNAPYCLISGTKQPKEVVNAFVNIFFGDVAGHIQGKYGAIGQSIEFDGKTVTKLQLEDGAYAPAPSIVADVPGLTRREYPVLLQNDPKKSEVDRNKFLAKQDTLQKGIESGLIYTMTNKYTVPYSDAYATLSADINKIFQEAIVKAITGELTPEQAVQNYREQMRAIGAQQVLDEANEFLGVQSTMEY